MALPPLLVGGDQLSATWLLPAVVVSEVGAPGAVATTGGVADASLEGAEAPTEFTASTS